MNSVNLLPGAAAAYFARNAIDWAAHPVASERCGTRHDMEEIAISLVHVFSAATDAGR